MSELYALIVFGIIAIAVCLWVNHVSDRHSDQAKWKRYFEDEEIRRSRRG